MGLRERRQVRTRETIIRVAYRLFREHGYDGTTVDTIAAEAEVSPRTFYRYFESKDGVLARGGFEIVDRALDRVGAEPTFEALVMAMGGAYQEWVAQDHLREHARLLRENPRLSDRAPLWRERWARHLAVRLAEREGLSEPTVDLRVRSVAAVLVLAVAIDEWVARAAEPSVVGLVAATLERLRESISA